MMRASRSSETSISLRVPGSSSGAICGDEEPCVTLTGEPVSILATMDFGMVSVLSPMVYSTRPFRSTAESATIRVPLLRTIVSACAKGVQRRLEDTASAQNVIIVRTVLEHYCMYIQQLSRSRVTKVLLLALTLGGAQLCVQAQEKPPAQQ